MTNHEIANYGEMLDDDDAIEEVGSELLREAIRASTAERLGVPPEDPSVERTVAEGQRVPIDLRNKVDLTEEGLAADAWTDSWTDIGVWQRNWSQSAAETVHPGLDGLDVTDVTPIRRFQIRSKLSEHEREVLHDLDMMEDI